MTVSNEDSLRRDNVRLKIEVETVNELWDRIRELENKEYDWTQSTIVYYTENQQLKQFIVDLSKKVGVEPPKQLLED